MRTLILNSSHLPIFGGVEIYMDAVARALDDAVSIAPADAGHDAFDAAASYPIHRYDPDRRRFGYPQAWGRVLDQVDGHLGSSAASLVPLDTHVTLLCNRHMLRWSASQGLALAACPKAARCLVGTVLPSGVIARLLHDRAGIPYGVFTHAAELLEWERNWRTRRLKRLVLDGATRVSAVSAFTRGLLIDGGVPAHRIDMVPPGIDPAPFLADVDPSPLRERLGIGDRKVVLTHGRLDPRKGQDHVIAALPRVREAIPDVCYLITGTGQHRDALEAAARAAGVADLVVFGGRVEADEIAAVYHACDVFVMNSRRLGHNVEGFGIVCLEAAAAGKPVLGGNTGGVPDALDDGVTGHLVDPEDPEDIARRLIELLSDEDRARAMGEAGRARVRRDFDEAAFARRVRGFADGVRRAPAATEAVVS